MVCDECLPQVSAEREERLRTSGRATLAAMRTSDADPAQSDDARAKRSASLSDAGRAVRAWEREHGKDVDTVRYESAVLPLVQMLTVPQLAASDRTLQELLLARSSRRQAVAPVALGSCGGGGEECLILISGAPSVTRS